MRHVKVFESLLLVPMLFQLAIPESLLILEEIFII